MVLSVSLASFSNSWEVEKLARGYTGSAYLPGKIMNDSVQVTSWTTVRVNLSKPDCS